MTPASSTASPTGTDGASKKVLHRRKHKNSRLGCPQCRKRRIKCDETLPSCKRCISRKVACGYLDYSQHELDNIRQAHTQRQAQLNNASSTQQGTQQLVTPPMNPFASHSDFVVHTNYALSQKQQQPHQLPFALRQQTVDYIQPIAPYNQQPYQHCPAPSHFSLSTLPSQETLRPSSQAPEQDNLSPSNIISKSHYRFSPSTSDSPLSYSSRKLLLEAYIHPIEQLTKIFNDRASSTPTTTTTSLTQTDSPVPASFPLHPKATPPEFNKDTRSYEVALIPHKTNKPKYDPQRFPEFMGETMSMVFSRLYIFSELHGRIFQSPNDEDLFQGNLFQATAVLLPHVPQLQIWFLKFRDDCIKAVQQNLVNPSDSNSKTTLHLISFLSHTTCFYQDSTYKDFFALAAGPGIYLRVLFENPNLVPKTFPLMQSYADGYMFTSKYVWFPQYKPEILYEFLEIFREFGDRYIVNSTNIHLRQQYDQCLEFILYTLNLFEKECRSNHVVKFPIEKLFKLLKKGLAAIPSEIYTIGSGTPKVQMIFCVFWFTLIEILKLLCVDCTYIFTFFLDGYYTMFPFEKTQVLKGLEDGKLVWYLNYLCRILAFLVRRHAYVLRNTILNDPIPNYINLKERLETRSLDIHEVAMKSFKKDVIMKANYPSESLVSENLVSVTNLEKSNYYKNPEKTDDLSSLLENFGGDQLLRGMNKQLNDEEELDFINGINPNTSLLKRDYDPRFVDPIFDKDINFQKATLEFLDKYIEDRRLIMKMSSNSENEDAYNHDDERDGFYDDDERLQ